MVEKFGISDRMRDPVKSLSGGLQRRVELAKALLHQPQVLLLDEPTNGLDPNVSKDFWNYLTDLLRQERITILLTTHSLLEAERCESLVLIDRGSVVAEGSPEKLKKEIGQEVVVVQTPSAVLLAESIRRDFQVEAEPLEDLVRIERENAHLMIAQLVDRYSEQIESVTVSKPSLEDVFLRKTGHRFESPEVQF
jgi:ABC-2 type transport system ATP-binding protein